MNYDKLLKLAEEFEEAAQTLRSGQLPHLDRPINLELVESEDSWGEFENDIMNIVYGLEKISEFAKENSEFFEKSLKDPTSTVEFKDETLNVLDYIKALCNEVHDNLKHLN